MFSTIYMVFYLLSFFLNLFIYLFFTRHTLSILKSYMVMYLECFIRIYISAIIWAAEVVLAKWQYHCSTYTCSTSSYLVLIRILHQSILKERCQQLYLDSTGYFHTKNNFCYWNYKHYLLHKVCVCLISAVLQEMVNCKCPLKLQWFDFIENRSYACLNN